MTKTILYLLILILHLENAVVAAGVKPFVFIPDRYTQFKKMHVNHEGIVVVTGNRVVNDQNVSEESLVLYQLGHNLELLWFFESEKESRRTIDAVITDDAIYVLNMVNSNFLKTKISKYERSTGHLIWEKDISETKNAMAQRLHVNHQTGTVIASGVVNEVSHVWWYDDKGQFINAWAEDLAEFNGTFGSGVEFIHDLYILNDDSVIALFSREFNQGSIMVLHIDSMTNKLFEYTRNGDVHIADGETPFMSLSSENRVLVQYSDEDNFGIPKLNQFILNEHGEEIFFNKSASYRRTMGSRATELKTHSDSVISILRKNNESNQMYFVTTDFNGLSEEVASYAYSELAEGEGEPFPLGFSLNEQNDLFVTSGISNAFPDHTSDTLYFQMNNYHACEEKRVAGIDFNADSQIVGAFIYELRFVGPYERFGRELHVIKHLHCSGDMIFSSGFEPLSF